jgi:capsular polysaccharide biosynthesis protein
LPTDPFKPNRILIILIGFVSAFISGSFFFFFLEGMDNTIKKTDQIKNITGVPVLSTISFIVTSEEKRS